MVEVAEAILQRRPPGACWCLSNRQPLAGGAVVGALLSFASSMLRTQLTFKPTPDGVCVGVSGLRPMWRPGPSSADADE